MMVLRSGKSTLKGTKLPPQRLLTVVAPLLDTVANNVSAQRDGFYGGSVVVRPVKTTENLAPALVLNMR